MASSSWDDVAAALAVRPPGRVADEVSARAAVAVVLREAAAGGLEVLFIRRADHPEDPWSGQMAFPGGRAEPADIDLRATAVRETLEETGIDLTAEAELLGALDEVRAMARMRPMDLAITPFVFRLRGPGVVRLSTEVRSTHWLALDELVSPDLRSTMEYAHLGNVLHFPCLRVQDAGSGGLEPPSSTSGAADSLRRSALVIWGLTYRMFLGLLERLGLPSGTAAPLAAAAADTAASHAPAK